MSIKNPQAILNSYNYAGTALSWKGGGDIDWYIDHNDVKFMFEYKPIDHVNKEISLSPAEFTKLRNFDNLDSTCNAVICGTPSYTSLSRNDPCAFTTLKMLEDNPIYTVDERIHIPTNEIQNAPRYQYDHYICEKIGVLGNKVKSPKEEALDCLIHDMW